MPFSTARTTTTVKTAAALLGGGAVLVMAAVTMITSSHQEDSGVSTLSDPAAMSTGQTTTVTYSGTIAPVLAVPPVKATPFGGSGAS